VSCSHDRNAFVWTFDNKTNTWKPALVILRIDRAALSCKWSFDGLRFAVTSSAKCVPICTYEGANDWWVSKTIRKKIKSTVLCCAFHPTNGQILATGGCDFKCRIFSTFTSDVDVNGVNCAPFSSPQEFGEVYAEYACMGWVNAVAWTPSGNTLCFAGHDSAIHFVNFAHGPEHAANSVQCIRFAALPLTSLIFVSESHLFAGGYDFNPIVFSFDGNGWQFERYVESPKVQSATTSTGVAAARALFQNKSTRGQDSKQESDTLWTSHENYIGCLQNAGPSGAELRRLSSSALDGAVVMWDLSQLGFSASVGGVAKGFGNMRV